MKKFKAFLILILSFVNISTSRSMEITDLDGTISEDFHHSQITQKFPSNIDLDFNPGLTSTTPNGTISPNPQLTENDNLVSEELNKISIAYMHTFKNDLNEISDKFLIGKCIASLCGFGAGVPFIQGALEAGKYYGVPGLGYCFATATVLYAGGIAAWTIWELIEKCEPTRGGLGLHEDEQPKNRLAKIAGSFVLGVLTSAPQVYLAYTYNSVKGMAIMNFCYESILRSLGVYKFISSINKNKLYPICQDATIKNLGLQAIDLSRVYFLRLHKEKNTLELALSLENCTTPKELYDYLSSTELFILDDERQIMPYYFMEGIPRKVVQAVSLIFPLGGALVNSVLAYKGFNLLTNNTVILPILATSSVFPTFILDAFATVEVVGGIFDVVYSFRHEVLPHEYFQAFYPKTKKIIIATSLLLGVSSAGGGIYLLLDSLNGTFLEPVKYVFTALAATTIVKFGVYAVANTLMNFGTVITKKIDKASSYTFDCLKKLDNLWNLVWESEPEPVQDFLDQIHSNYGPEK